MTINYLLQYTNPEWSRPIPEPEKDVNGPSDECACLQIVEDGGLIFLLTIYSNGWRADSFHFSVEEAKQQAKFEYGIDENAWMSKNELINKPNSKYDHLYIVLRYDPLQLSDERPEWVSDQEWEAFLADNPDSKRIADFGISGLKAFCILEEAEQEAERLNRIQSERLAKLDKDIEPPLYFVKWVRIKKGVIKEEFLPKR